jgi:hypothetical protein
MMDISVYLDNTFRSWATTGMMIHIFTTCIVMIYLLFRVASVIERLIGGGTVKDSITVTDGEVQIELGKQAYVIESRKLRALFWKLVFAAYVIGFALGFAVVIFVLLVIASPVWIRRIVSVRSVFGGAKRVLKIMSPK